MAELDSVRPGNAAGERTRHRGPPVTPTPVDKPRRLGDFEKAGSLFSLIGMVCFLPRGVILEGKLADGPPGQR